MIPVILSGGSGTRLWPLSRKHYPKQFLPLHGRHTMLQETIKRLDGVDGLQAPVVVCNDQHRFIVAEQLQAIDVNPSAIILEPAGRNTAPAIAIAALSADSMDSVLLVLPADHVIENKTAFQTAIVQAGKLAEQDFLVTFGIKPDCPATGYGYIHKGRQPINQGFSVAAFVEKPDQQLAEQYVDSGEYYWNSGIFVFKAGCYLEELEKYNPQMLDCCRKAYTGAKVDMDFVRLDKKLFSDCPADSIDYAVMEKTDRAAMIPLDVGWNDVGSWSALWDVAEKDASGNVTHGDVMTLDSLDSFIHAEKKLVAAVGVNDLIIVETDDAVLVAPKNKVQDVKGIVDQLNRMRRSEVEIHRKVYRPWGNYDAVDCGDRHKTKRIVVKPGAKLSLQKHHHRAEHWIVVKGTALVTKQDEQILLTENESTYIPVGVVHRLENPGKIPLEMIEVQSGSYLGEDDIVRYEDVYHRTDEDEYKT